MIGKSRKGIGELLAVIIVIAITIVAGLVLYSFVMGKISIFGNSPGLEIENAQITNGVLIISIKNTGSYAFSSVSYQIYPSSGLTPSSGSLSLPASGLQPGQSVAYTNQISGTQTGSVYTIVITGDYGNGQTYTVSTNVVAS
ncbi:MAG: hypothetical protein RAK25_06110 [TACK group archaeon]|nr:hypothetical protein [TACK group archaeon]